MEVKKIAKQKSMSFKGQDLNGEIGTIYSLEKDTVKKANEFIKVQFDNPVKAEIFKEQFTENLDKTDMLYDSATITEEPEGIFVTVIFKEVV